MKVNKGWIASQTGCMGRECIGIASTEKAAVSECLRQLALQKDEEKAFGRQYEEDQRETARSIGELIEEQYRD